MRAMKNSKSQIVCSIQKSIEDYKSCLQFRTLSIFFSQELLDSGFALREPIGVYEIAWKYSDVIKVLVLAKEKKMVILGGDVYGINNNEITTTYDSWYFSGNDFVKSFEKAKDYIDNYHKKNGDNFIYSLVIKDKILQEQDSK